MKTFRPTFILEAVNLALSLGASGVALAQAPADPGWPRVFKNDRQQLTVYQPQVDYWNGYTNLHFRAAIAVKGVVKEEKLGVAEVDAVTGVDHGARVVAIVPLKRELRFPDLPESVAAPLRQSMAVSNAPIASTIPTALTAPAVSSVPVAVVVVSCVVSCC